MELGCIVQRGQEYYYYVNLFLELYSTGLSYDFYFRFSNIFILAEKIWAEYQSEIISFCYLGVVPTHTLFARTGIGTPKKCDSQNRLLLNAKKWGEKE